jgi:hypothetical protein
VRDGFLTTGDCLDKERIEEEQGMTRTKLAALGVALLVAPTALADSVTIEPAKDNTLFEPSGLSNGSGDGLFCGRKGAFAGGLLVRALLQFDVAAAVPSGSTIDSVSLTLTVQASAPGSGDQVHTLHRVAQDWGEGDSIAFGGAGVPAEPGDATWTNTFFPTDIWDTPGGDFDATVSGSATVGIMFVGVTWESTAQMVADVQTWLDDPSSNFGWLMKGNEDVLQTAKRFGSREHPDPLIRPSLTIEFTPPACPDIDGDDVVGFSDLLVILSTWSPDPGSCPGCPGDVDGDDDVDFQDLLVILSEWGPCP